MIVWACETDKFELWLCRLIWCFGASVLPSLQLRLERTCLHLPSHGVLVGTSQQPPGRLPSESPGEELPLELSVVSALAGPHCKEALRMY